MILLVFFVSYSLYVVSAESYNFSLGEVQSHETLYVEDITYQKFVIKGQGSDTHIIHNLEIGRYSDFDVVLHDRLYGEDAIGKATVLEIALDYEAKTGKVVYAAVNGDFFSTLPIDFYAVENNILRIGYYDKNAFGFTDAHRSVVGKVDYGFKVNVYNAEGQYIDYIHIDRFNEPLSHGEIGVYTPDLSTLISGDDIAKLSINHQLIPNDSEFHYQGQVTSQMDDFSFNNDDYHLGAGEFVIAAKGESESYNQILDLIQTGNQVAIYPYPINDWQGMDYIIGGWQILLDRGQKLPEDIHGSPTSRHPRTTIAVNRDGEIGLTVVDGRMVNIPGLTLGELADLNEELGYYTALELDGGGSSTCLLRNLETNELEIMNTPSDGYLRSVVNAVLIVGDPIEEQPTTTIATTQVPTTTWIETTTTTYITTTEEVTTLPPITTTEPTTTSQTTNPTSTSQPTTDQTNYEEINTSGCSSCNNVNQSLIFFGLLSIVGLLIYRKK